MKKQMINNISWILLMLAVFFSVLVSCVHRSDRQLTEKVEAIYSSCLLCHSSQEMQRGPSLAGLDKDYILRQFDNFKKGIRGKNPVNRSEALMGSVNLEYDVDTLDALAEYISLLTPRPKYFSINGDEKKGEALYLDRCMSCHDGTKYTNKDFGAPNLKQMEGWYMMLQLKHYKAGRRGYHDADDSGRLMSLVLKDLSDEDLRDIVCYLERL